MKIKYFGRLEKTLLVLSALTLFVVAMMSKVFFEDDIETHDRNWMSVRGNSYINITYIEPDPIATDIEGTNLYLAGYRLSEQLANYFILQADPDSQDTQALLKNAEQLEAKPQRVLGSVNGSEPNQAITAIAAETSQSSDIDPEILLYFEEKDYFSLTDLENPTLSLMKAVAVTLVAYAIFAALPNILVWRRHRQAKQSAKELFEIYPELMGNLEQIRSGASYLEETVGLAIYKDHFIAFSEIFSAVDLRQVTDLDISAWGNKVSLVSPYGLLLWLLRATTIKTKGDSKRDKKVLLAHHRLGQSLVLDQFVSALEDHSSAIKITVRR